MPQAAVVLAGDLCIAEVVVGGHLAGGQVLLMNLQDFTHKRAGSLVGGTRRVRLPLVGDAVSDPLFPS